MQLRSQGHLNCLQFAHFHHHPRKHCLLKSPHQILEKKIQSIPLSMSITKIKARVMDSKQPHIFKCFIPRPLPRVTHKSNLHFWTSRFNHDRYDWRLWWWGVIMTHYGCILQSARHWTAPYTECCAVPHSTIQSIKHCTMHRHTTPSSMHCTTPYNNMHCTTSYSMHWMHCNVHCIVHVSRDAGISLRRI